MKQSKPFLENIRLRRQSFGTERKLNMCKMVLDHRPNFPLSVEYEDIDNAVLEWVKTKLDIGFEGKQLPTYKLYSNQRINEYAQSWQHLDETGNVLMNFKTITRENNPKKGEIQGGNFNIPGNRDYPMFAVPTLQENGQEAYDIYSMKQPMAIDFQYTLTLITNKYELLNKFNQMVNYQFKALQCYIMPNNHPMSMELQDISDESEYNIDDRKYYSQSFKIKVMGYIITKDDYKVTRIPSRFKVKINNNINDKKINKEKEAEVNIEEVISPCDIILPENERYVHKNIFLSINYPICTDNAEFIIDVDMEVQDIQITNICKFLLFVNEELINIEDGITFYNGDKITVQISRKNNIEKSNITFQGVDLNEIVDTYNDPESALDEDFDEEIEYNA